MNLLVSYVKQGDELRILGAYTETYSMERKTDFKPIKRIAGQKEIETYFEVSPMAFCNYFYTEVGSDLDEDSFVNTFSRKLFLSIQQFGDEHTLPALSMGSANGGE